MSRVRSELPDDPAGSAASPLVDPTASEREEAAATEPTETPLAFPVGCAGACVGGSISTGKLDMEIKLLNPRPRRDFGLAPLMRVSLPRRVRSVRICSTWNRRCEPTYPVDAPIAIEQSQTMSFSSVVERFEHQRSKSRIPKSQMPLSRQGAKAAKEFDFLLLRALRLGVISYFPPIDRRDLKLTRRFFPRHGPNLRILPPRPCAPARILLFPTMRQYKNLTQTQDSEPEPGFIVFLLIFSSFVHYARDAPNRWQGVGRPL